ncbi:MAG: hypothetical protein NTX61_13430 [Bacteroidetes bacterium]|nr:hypothetical protein [Bacteroidota bacterium]
MAENICENIPDYKIPEQGQTWLFQDDKNRIIIRIVDQSHDGIYQVRVDSLSGDKYLSHSGREITFSSEEEKREFIKDPTKDPGSRATAKPKADKSISPGDTPGESRAENKADKTTKSLPQQKDSTFSNTSKEKPQQPADRAKQTRTPVNSFIYYPYSPPANYEKIFRYHEPIADELYFPGVRLPLQPIAANKVKKSTRPKMAITQRERTNTTTLEQPHTNNIEPPGDTDGTLTPQSNSHKTLTPALAKLIVDTIVKDNKFEKQLKGDNFQSFLTHNPFPTSWGWAGGYRNFFLWVKGEDAQDEEVKNLVCVGIAENVVKILKQNPEVINNLNEIREVHRLLSYNYIVLKDMSFHTAVYIKVGQEEYVLDWHKTLQSDNPMIFMYTDWASGKDGKGILYKDFIAGEQFKK